MNHRILISSMTCFALSLVPGLSVSSVWGNEPPTNTEAQRHYEKAYELRKAADYDAAIAEYEKVVQLSPNSKIGQDAQYWIGQVYFESKQFDMALATFQALLDKYPASSIIPSAKQMVERVQQAKKNRALFEAVKKPDVEQVKVLITKGADIDARWGDVNTKEEEKKAGAHEANNTPLCYAVISNNMDLVKLLVEAGADVNAGEWPPLCRAVDENNTAIAEYLIDHGANVNAYPVDESWGALQETANISNSIEMVKLLLARGADINSKGYPVLNSAVYEERKDLCEFLIQRGADVNAKDKWGQTSLYLAIRNDDYLYFMKLLITNGARVDSTCPGGETLLQYAAIRGKTEAVKLLLEAGADINVKDDRGQTLIHRMLDVRRNSGNSGYPEAKDTKDTIELLLNKGADVNLKDKNGRTPLHLAAESADRDIVELLLDKGARINEKDDESGFTPLHHAARFGKINVAELLIARGADINAKDKQRHTPLQVAVNHDSKVAELLINKGADTSVQTESGKTLLQLAQERKKIESTVPDLILDGEPNSAIGQAITCGDVDGDGYDDILIAAPGYDNNRGRVYLFYGGLDMDTTADLIFEGQNEGDNFGGIACGDIDNDGHDDIIIGANGYNEKQGRAYLYWGSDRNSMDANPDKILVGDEERNAKFGAGAAIYDIDNDGHGDIILGSLHSQERIGRAYLYYGNTKKLMDTSYDLIFTGEDPYDFGAKIRCGDIDNDGYRDMVIGPWWPSHGRAYLFYGANKLNMDAKADVIFKAQSEGDDHFGTGMVCVDQNGDGCDDVVIGSPGYNDNQGRAYLFYGNSKRSLDTEPDMTFNGEVEGSLYGCVGICYGDIDGDKVNDLIIGAYFYRQRVGRVYVYWGDELAGPNPRAGMILTGENRYDLFGCGLACGDVNNDGFDDLVIGASRYKAGLGHVYLYYGGPRNK